MGKRTVLVVEDDPDLRTLLQTAVEQAGFATEGVADGASALTKLSERVFDAVCLDVILPDLSGYDVCEQLRQSGRHKSTLVVMMSARSYPADCANALEVGADTFLAKPFSLRTLVDTLETAAKRESGEAVVA